MSETQSLSSEPSFPLYVISGGVGSSGEQLARTVLAQFPDSQVDVELFPKIFTKGQVNQILQRAVEESAVVAHTFVDPILRRTVKETAHEMNVAAIDLVGPLMENLSQKLDQKPLGKPGLYRQLYQSYFSRIEAMHYSLDHDDGKNRQGWQQAEIILLGASRVGKTPLSLYLSVMGWMVANVPLVAGIAPHASLFKLQGPQLVGLTIAPGDLIDHRKHRQSRLGVAAGRSEYVDPQKVYQEIEAIEATLKRHRIPIIDVTAKPIESSADEIIRLVRRKRRNTARG